jgi:hypothetical protein
MRNVVALNVPRRIVVRKPFTISVAGWSTEAMWPGRVPQRVQILEAPPKGILLFLPRDLYSKV